MRSLKIFLRRYPIAWWASVVLVAGASGFIVFSSVSSSQAAAARLGGMVNVPVVTRDIEPGDAIGAGDVATAEWPRALLPQAPMVERPEGSIASARIASGTPLSVNLVAESAIGRAASSLRPGERGFTFPRDDSTPGLVVGDWIDLFSSPANGTAPEAKVIGAGLRVIEISETTITVAAPMEDASVIAAASGERMVAAVTLPVERRVVTQD